MTVSKHGLELDGADQGWESRIYRREAERPGEQTYPVLHACTLPLPADRGDFGSGIVDRLGREDVFVSLIEFGPEVADQGLFAPQGMPQLRPSQFSANRMARSIPGVSAAQHFLSVGGRAFCLFVVLGAHSRRMVLVPRAERLVRTVRITDRRTMQRMGAMR
ncbi:hypothetical protein ACPPVT_19075 [Angustibacter sp. McL0619]|uniref:hypothetical protein n=1 Tax=Angustibacter sp. McL0619 TaxID=3415676 RepID=UPI003CECD003